MRFTRRRVTKRHEEAIGAAIAALSLAALVLLVPKLSPLISAKFTKLTGLEGYLRPGSRARQVSLVP